MNHSDLVEAYRRESGVTLAEAKLHVRQLTEVLANGIVRDGNLTISQLGTFKVKKTPSRPGRNPRTNEPVTIPEGVRVSFSPAKALKDRLS